MRGLTAEERWWLQRWERGCPADAYPCDSVGPLLAGLLDAGRVSVRWDGGDIREWPPTDLGRLALRVCPVGEL